MRDGTYGACDGCEKPIPLARLQALPYATMCIDCQRESEKSGHPGKTGADWARLVDPVSFDNDVALNDIEIDVS
jgi:DnaK suppressor protein